MDMLQLVFAFVNAPLFATFLLGMFWKRTTGHGAFFGLLSGTMAAAVHHGLTLPQGGVPGVKGGWLGACCTFIRARWRRISGRRSTPGPPACGHDIVSLARDRDAPRRTTTRGLVYSLTRGRGTRTCLVASARRARRVVVLG